MSRLSETTRRKKAKAEAVKLTDIQKELSHLDALLSGEVSILRDRIEEASMEFLEAQKRYGKAEKEFVDAKIDLHRKSEMKESLTEHLYTIIYQNEVRKSKKLAELMEKLEMECSAEDLTVDLPPAHVSMMSSVQTLGPYGPVSPTHFPRSPSGDKSVGELKSPLVSPVIMEPSGSGRVVGNSCPAKSGEICPGTCPKYASQADEKNWTGVKDIENSEKTSAQTDNLSPKLNISETEKDLDNIKSPILKQSLENCSNEVNKDAEKGKLADDVEKFSIEKNET